MNVISGLLGIKVYKKERYLISEKPITFSTQAFLENYLDIKEYQEANNISIKYYGIETVVARYTSRNYDFNIIFSIINKKKNIKSDIPCQKDFKQYGYIPLFTKIYPIFHLHNISNNSNIKLIFDLKQITLSDYCEAEALSMSNILIVKSIFKYLPFQNKVYRLYPVYNSDEDIYTFDQNYKDFLAKDNNNPGIIKPISKIDDLYFDSTIIDSRSFTFLKSIKTMIDYRNKEDKIISAMAFNSWPEMRSKILYYNYVNLYRSKTPSIFQTICSILSIKKYFVKDGNYALKNSIISPEVVNLTPDNFKAEFEKIPKTLTQKVLDKYQNAYSDSHQITLYENLRSDIIVISTLALLSFMVCMLFKLKYIIKLDRESFILKYYSRLQATKDFEEFSKACYFKSQTARIYQFCKIIRYITINNHTTLYFLYYVYN